MKNIQHIQKALLFSASLFTLSLTAQTPVPAKPQSKSVLIMNATAHLGNGNVIENSVVGFKDGKIILVGDARTIRIDGRMWDTTISASGKQLYPGFIAPNSTIGLGEVEAVRATMDVYEVGQFKPNVRSLIAYNTDSKIIPTVRTNGVLVAQVCPRGGRIPGTSSVMGLDGWNWEDAVLKADDGVHLNWPSLIDYGDRGLEISKKYSTQLTETEQFFTDAYAYSKAAKTDEKNLRYEAMRGLFDGTKTLFIHADYVKEITEAVAFSKKMMIKKMVIVGGTDSWKCADILKANNVAVMLYRLHSLPSANDGDVDESYKAAAQLQQAGVLFCLQNEGDQEAPGARNLPFLAGTAAAYGLTKEQAVAAVTGNTAKILGIDASCGTIEEGKNATLFISSGDALDMRTNNVTNAWINGKTIDLRNEQKDLYIRYMAKYAIPIR